MIYTNAPSSDWKIRREEKTEFMKIKIFRTITSTRRVKTDTFPCQIFEWPAPRPSMTRYVVSFLFESLSFFILFRFLWRCLISDPPRLCSIPVAECEPANLWIWQSDQNHGPVDAEYRPWVCGKLYPHFQRLDFQDTKLWALVTINCCGYIVEVLIYLSRHNAPSTTLTFSSQKYNLLK